MSVNHTPDIAKALNKISKSIAAIGTIPVIGIASVAYSTVIQTASATMQALTVSYNEILENRNLAEWSKYYYVLKMQGKVAELGEAAKMACLSRKKHIEVKLGNMKRNLVGGRSRTGHDSEMAAELIEILELLKT
eukprot:GFYU01019717.1.p1 GENE.GFYU01019717.1~~GFYU01019717.1.p1  ORF type:complete len:156 (-),score=25.76 GFYU01019717.1:38-442(-)